jgi:hypothetical protein
MITGRRLGRLWFVRLATIYGYTGDLAAALAGLGIGAPVVALMSGKQDGNAFEVIRETLPAPWIAVGAAALVIWVMVRLVVQREDILSRALLARDCAQTMKGLRPELFVSLRQADPMPKITAIQKSVDDSVQNAIKNRVWKWEPLPPQDEIADELKRAVDEIRTNFMHLWRPRLQQTNHRQEYPNGYENVTSTHRTF